MTLYRHSGQRSRVRKLQYIAELERTVDVLQVIPKRNQYDGYATIRCFIEIGSDLSLMAFMQRVLSLFRQ